ncbi:Fic/DOC family N-terminal domain-containing protein [Candidatus Frankia nodulisporulans]|uniref:Fic/DOC family N-terminal domain-containing protein n=1 Tax=Candidatus Frankia nodulisporulans TaxID=2060052 RepID=UPI0037039F2F
MRIAGTGARTGEYEHIAFQPHPLGEEEPNLAGTTWRAVAAAGTELGRLGQAGRQLPDPTLLRQPTLRAEAQSTSALEGTFASLEDVLAADLTEPGARSASTSWMPPATATPSTGVAWRRPGSRPRPSF